MNLRTAFDVLVSHGLLRETVSPSSWSLDPDSLPEVTFDAVSYDTRTVTPTTLLFCKGNFKPEFLNAANTKGLQCYVAEEEYSGATDALGLIVNDIRKAMALLSAQFYGHPEKELFVMGITGTKGKTTTAYLTHAVMNAHTKGKTALMSSEQTCLDGVNSFESDLTTPESLDLFRMMRQARDHGMTHLVMEVSSQAYKLNRVYGITFDVGAFLNISPDHISPIEHPTFEDYFYCKRRLIENSKTVVLNAALDYSPLLLQTAALYDRSVITFSKEPGATAMLEAIPTANGYDFRYTAEHGSASSDDSTDSTALNLGAFHLVMDGDFNYANALAAVGIALAAGTNPSESDALHSLEPVTIPGRMQKFEMPDGTIAYVDYAHNYISLKSLLDFTRTAYPDSYVTVVTGTAGGKALDRREGMAKAASEGADSFILTDEDSNFEDPHAIGEEMAADVTNPNLDVAVIDGRENAIRAAFQRAHDNAAAHNVVLVIGKGDEEWLKIKGKHVPYASDTAIVEQLSRSAVTE